MSVAIKQFPVTFLPRALAAPMAFGNEELVPGNEELETEEASDDAEAEAQSQADAAKADSEATERQARAQGWRPEAEFKGDGKWVDAATFVDRGNKFKKNLEKEVATLKEQVAAQKKTNEQFAVFHKEAMARKETELSDAIKAAKLQRSEAIRNGEDEDALALDDRIETLQEEKLKLKAEPAKEVETADPDKAAATERQAVLDSWIEDGNEWFKENPKLRAYALAIGQEFREAGDNAVDRKFLDKIKAQMEVDMPEKFRKGNPLRHKPGSVEAGSPGTQQQQGKTERDLPKQDRELMQKFVKDGLMTKEAFLKEYNWS